jgi:uncharacterized Fe-S cluster-containing radical SAM superfamily protein
VELKVIDTEDFSTKLRDRIIDREGKKLLITRITDTDQNADLTAPANCNGYGRIRHFRRSAIPDWPDNPLPLAPAEHALGLKSAAVLKAQVFQNAACNWRCRYCYVPFKALSGDQRISGWFSAEELVSLYRMTDNRPEVIDLSGGQPELTPEWVPWMMDALCSAGISTSTFLWSDDNLSNDYFWRFLSETEIEKICNYKMYARVCCFKGFDSKSFSFNTQAAGGLFEQQFILFERYLRVGIDLYAYVTLTTPDVVNLNTKMEQFVDRLQLVHELLPLRVVPLKILPFSVVNARMNEPKGIALQNQQLAVEEWQRCLQKRFRSSDLTTPITSVKLS